MAEIEDRELILFVLGCAAPDVAARITERAGADEEFAAKLRIVQSLIGDEPAAKEPDEGVVSRLLRALRNRKFLLAACLFLAAIGVGWAGYAMFTPSPLLEDDFQGSWFDAGKWLVPRRVVRQEDGHLRLINRGAIVTQEEFPGPISISFRWRWLDLAGDPLYADHLTIALRTRGFFAGEWPFEVQDGILVRLNGWGGTASIFSVTDEKVVVTRPVGSAPMPPDAWHTVRITDDGQTIRLYLGGPEIPEQYLREPFLSLHHPVPAPHHHIAIYNRELVADAAHESQLDEFRLERLGR
jgi:hypothetical protein